MLSIKIPIQSNKEAVKLFLIKLKEILESKDFNEFTDFLLIQSHKTGIRGKYSTPYTLLDLDYTVEDIIKVLEKLTVENYSETLFDKDDAHPPYLFVFGKRINAKQVYVKVKIKNYPRKIVLCVSFHYAEHQMVFPYSH